MTTERDIEHMLWKEEVANIPKHWVRAVTACNSRCVFCLDSDTPRNVFLSVEDIRKELDRGRDELGAEKVIISGGEASLHPEFSNLIRYARERGYDRVQTVTNGYRYAEKEFFDECMDAGLGEITFSLHGHNEELHDRLTGTPGAFKRLIKGMVRALRDGRPIVNVDVVINKQNVGVLDKIIELCITLGVTEFDLLHVIPQAAAFDNRDQLFYDPREYLPVLHKVFRLNRHPRFVIWTNRFPVSFLEGLEDLIQDPHKMLDEVNGRRFQVRRYLDEGASLDCRHAERCPHCFIEPFCTTMDRVIEAQRGARFEVWDVATRAYAGEPLPYGCSLLGVEAPDLAALSALDFVGGSGLYARVATAEPLPAEIAKGRTLALVAKNPAQLDAWLGHPLPAGVEIEIVLTQETALWLVEHREAVRPLLDRVRVHQPSHEHLHTASAEDVREPRAFFQSLALPVRVSGLPICLTPGAEWIPERAILEAGLFDQETGRLDIRELSRYHVRARYRAKSVRCSDCRVNDRCEGAHINMVRDQGLAPLTPLVEGEEAERAQKRLEALFPEPEARLAHGCPSQAVAPSLPGYPEPQPAPLDPLMVIELERQKRRAERGLPVIPQGGTRRTRVS
jgi:MoaA/NifB/PqqE/SkfB family radical SAM enzyme